jgi:hypothetical protein
MESCLVPNNADELVRALRAAFRRQHAEERTSAGIFKQSMGAKNRVGIGLSFRPARLHGTQPGGIGSSESIPGLPKSLKIRAQ